MEGIRTGTSGGKEALAGTRYDDRVIPVAADHAFEALRGHVDGHANVPECHGHIPAGAAVDIHSIREVEEDEVVTPAAEEGVGAEMAVDAVIASAALDDIALRGADHAFEA